MRTPSVLEPTAGIPASELVASTQDPLPQLGQERVTRLAIHSPTAPAVTAKDELDSPAEETSQLSPAELRELLPEWMDYEGVDLHSEYVTIAGRTVARTRGRFKWPNGSLMEMEVTDLGFEPNEILLKSLGFNVDTLGDVPSTELIPVREMPHGVLNQEYDEETAEGFIQLVVENRFLVEVQLEKLPYESFQAIVDFQLPLDALIALTATERK
jgi:hypothetical protein